MSDCKGITKVTHDKWATVSNLLGSLMINEWIAHFWGTCSGCSFAHKKTSDSLKKIWLKSYFLVRFFISLKKTSDSLMPSFLMSSVSVSLSSVTKIEWCEWTAQVAHLKWANERIVGFFSKSLIRSLLAHFFAITSDSLGKPMSELPTLIFSQQQSPPKCCFLLIFFNL